jgi:hypothetical protein
MLIKNVNFEQAKKELFKYNPTHVKQSMSKQKPLPFEEKKEKADHTNILDDCISESLVVDSLMYHTWLKTLTTFREERQIPERYKMFLAYKGRYKGRIIIPIYDNHNNIIFFQGRRIPNTSLEPKYLNPPTGKDIILNKSAFKRDKSIIVTEGLIDAFMVGNQGTSCLGKSFSDDLIKSLLKLTNKTVILAFDNDEAGDESLDKFLQESEYSRKVQYFVAPEEYDDCKDINNIRTEKNITDMYEFIVNNSYSHFKVICGGF